jgi:hypothetical protein
MQIIATCTLQIILQLPDPFNSQVMIYQSSQQHCFNKLYRSCAKALPRYLPDTAAWPAALNACISSSQADWVIRTQPNTADTRKTYNQRQRQPQRHMGASWLCNQSEPVDLALHTHCLRNYIYTACCKCRDILISFSAIMKPPFCKDSCWTKSPRRW